MLYGLLLLLGIALYVFAMGVSLRRPGRAAKLVMMVSTVAFAVWITFFIISLTDYRDADGWVDCANACTTLQTTTGSVLFFGLAALAICAFGSLAAPMLDRLRASRR